MTGQDDPSGGLARVQARLERERLARREAERIAESTLREVYLRQEDLRLLERVTRAANEGGGPLPVIARILKHLCEYTGWTVAHAYLLNGDVLEPFGPWHVVGEDPRTAFREASEARVFARGEGIPGMVVASGEPVWVAHYDRDPRSLRREAAEASGLGICFAFPVTLKGEVVAVIELLAVAAAEPEGRVLDVLVQAGVQIGRVIERDRADAALRSAHAELQESVDELERSNQELEAFAYIASHDLQEPLRTVAGFVQLLERRYKGRLDERGDEYIRYTVDAVVRMQALITDLLTYSRLGRRQLQREPVDLGVLVGYTERALAQALAESGGTLVVAGELPTVDGDASQLGQVLDNLVGNGLKFSGDAPPRVTVSAEREPDDRGWRIAVDDEGIGVPPEQAEAVFEMFRRLHSRDEIPGTGIGLAVCHKIVERHGGAIGVQARPTGGSRFWFTLPDRG